MANPIYKEKNPCNIDRCNDMVRKEFKKYKKRKPPPDFSDVVDFCQPELFKDKIEKIELEITDDVNNIDYAYVGLKHPKEWKVYELKTSSGFLVVPNPFLSYAAQSHWVKQTLTTYTKDPYPSNLDILMKLDKSKSTWDISKEKSDDNSFINQLRWVHMGYHFDYNTVDYKLKTYHGFPHDLATLTQTIAKTFQFPDYVAETAIINYYPDGSSMGGHTDHYEEELSQPLIGYTFGQSAVYLIGGKTRDIKPEAIWVRSGDIMLMTNESRLAFHAVPCIITKSMKTAPADIGSCPLGNKVAGLNSVFSEESNGYCWKNQMIEESWNDFAKYISETRININIRQVHKYDNKNTNS